MIELEQIKYELPELQDKLVEASEALDLTGLKKKLKDINDKTQQQSFWDDHENAQKVMKEKKSLENKIDEYESIATTIEDIEVMIEMAEEMEDESMIPEIQEAFEKAGEEMETLRLATLLTGEYDANSAIMSFNGGSGGTEAKDWAEMLLRMYIRWSERKGYKVKIVDYQENKEGGISSATIFVEGENAYGYLKNERGVHRLVRISPFDAAGRRHTSFASVDVSPEIDDDITVEIDPEDIRVDTYRSSGAGGQHVNTTDSAIRITHLPTKIVVSCQNERSQHQNRDMAMKMLMSKLIELKEQEQKENLKELQGDYSQITWGSQIRSYVFHPYTMVKDHRTGAEVGNVNAVMDGDLDYFINEKLKQKE